MAKGNVTRTNRPGGKKRPWRNAQEEDGYLLKAVMINQHELNSIFAEVSHLDTQMEG